MIESKMGANESEKIKFASQADPKLLAAFKTLAKSEGRQFQALLDEAMRDFLEKKQTGRARTHVLAAFQDSVREFEPLYRELAK